ncbi:MAG: hypothetical protein AAF627_22235 [Myxococcota bacterium]
MHQRRQSDLSDGGLPELLRHRREPEGGGLRTNSSSNSCRTFADPSDAAECVEMALAGATADTFSELSTRLSADCDEFRFFSTPFRFEPPSSS